MHLSEQLLVPLAAVSSTSNAFMLTVVLFVSIFTYLLNCGGLGLGVVSTLCGRGMCITKCPLSLNQCDIEMY